MSAAKACIKTIFTYIIMLLPAATSAQDTLFAKHSVSASITNVLSWGSGFNLLEHLSYNYRLTQRKQLSAGVILQLLRSKQYEYDLISDADMRIGVFTGYSYSFIRENRKSYWKIGGQFWYGQGDFLYGYSPIASDDPERYYTPSAIYGIAEVSKVKRFKNGWSGQFNINFGARHLYGTGIAVNHPVLGLGFSLSKNLFAAKANRYFDSVSKNFPGPGADPAVFGRDITKHSLSLGFNGLRALEEGINWLLIPSYTYRLTPRHEITAGIILEPYKPRLAGGTLKAAATTRIGMLVAYSRNYIGAGKKNHWKVSPQLWYTFGDFYDEKDLHPEQSAYFIIEAARVVRFNNAWALQFFTNAGIKSPYWTGFWPPVWGIGIALKKDF